MALGSEPVAPGADAGGRFATRARVTPGAKALAVPLAAFALSRALIWLEAATAGISFPGQRALVRHDSVLYLSIARHGFTLFRCDRPGGWCGNSGWLPAYSLLISPFDRLGVSAALAGVLLSALFQLGSLVLLWRGFLESRVSAKNLAVLATAAVFPGSIYYAAVFPLSLLTFLTLAAMYCATRGRTAWTAAAAAAAAATYPIGIVVAGALALCELVRSGSPATRLSRSALIAGAGALGIGVVSVAQRLATGHWNAYVLVQRHYSHTGVNPWSVLRVAKEEALSFAHNPHRLDLVPSLQLLLVAAFVAAVVLTLIFTRHRDDLPAALIVVSAWLMPLALGGVSLYRSDAALLPGLLLTRRLPLAAQVAFAVAAALVSFEMNRLFFQSRLT